MTKVKRCDNCKHYQQFIGSQGVDVCNKFHKYALVARNVWCTNENKQLSYWEKIPPPPKVKRYD